MGGKNSKEENTAHTHGNQLVTVIQTQDAHTEEHRQQQGLLMAVIALQIIILLLMVTKIIFKTMRKRWMNKGIQAAKFIASINNV